MVDSSRKETSVNTETKPKVLIVYYSLTQQSGRVAEAMAQALDGTRAATSRRR